MELVSGKITLTLRDFSNGRGDMAITAHYNLDIADSGQLPLVFRIPRRRDRS